MTVSAARSPVAKPSVTRLTSPRSCAARMPAMTASRPWVTDGERGWRALVDLDPLDVVGEGGVEGGEGVGARRRAATSNGVLR